MTDLLMAYGTAFHGTRIHRRGASYEWVRHPGPLRREPFTPVTPEVRAAVEALRTGAARLTLGTPDGPARRYPVSGLNPLGTLLLTGPDDETRVAMDRLLHATGRALHTLHTGVPDTDGAARGPAGVGRLAVWLRGGQGPQHAPRLFETVRERLGAERCERVLAWCAETGPDHPDAVFLHGGVSLGALIPDPAPDPDTGPPTGAARLGVTGTLLIGEDLARGPAEYDVGWLLGELAEFRLLPQGSPAPDAADRLLESGRRFLTGYGPSRLSLTAVGRVATLRILTHAHDFAAYVGWHDQLPVYADLVADLLDSDGAAALPDLPVHVIPHPRTGVTS
ncbi:hypothetical protein [Streptomyces sp. RG80]|uniref:hypothetical protein n=1 Tax=Streptomyces sp. RG80 TaxID=3157340 RepID=UPI00338E59A2